MKLIELPPEVIATIFSRIPGQDLGHVCQTCKLLRDIVTNVDRIWQRRCESEFGFTSLQGWNCSYREIYSKVLHKYGKTLGLWKILLEFYGGILHVKFADGMIYGEELYPLADVRQPFKSKPVFSIQLNNSKNVEINCLKGYSSDKLSCDIDFVPGEKLIVTCSDVEGATHRHPEGRDTEYELFSEQEEERGTMEELINFRFAMVLKHETEMMTVPLELPQYRPDSFIQPGLFRGTYGGHGTEVILFTYSDDGTEAHGLKITGDPNVPAGQISVFVDLRRPMVLSEEQQTSIATLRHIDTPDIPPGVDYLGLPDQAFVVPTDCDERETEPPKTCKYRFHCQGTIAGMYFQNPSKCKAHWVVFDEDTFGVLWLELYSFSLYSRVKDKLTL